MAQRLYTNNASTTLAAPITSGATSLSLTSGGGALFPNPPGGQYFIATLIKIVSGAVTALEIIKVTGRATDTFTTIVRGQEGTTALAWNAGDTCALLPTAGDMTSLVQFDDLQQQLANYAIDTGAANAYAVNLTPALTAHVIGAPVRFIAAHTNTTACTFNDGAGAAALVISPGVQIPAGTIVAGGFYTANWDGTQFQLKFSPNLALYATVASLGTYVTSATLVSTLTNYLLASLAASTYAPIASPLFTGNPRAPTPATNDNDTSLATTQFVQAVVNQQITKVGTFTCANGTVSVSFASAFPNVCQGVFVQWQYPGADVGTVVPGSTTAGGFQYLNGNSGLCSYIAVGN